MQSEGKFFNFQELIWAEQRPYHIASNYTSKKPQTCAARVGPSVMGAMLSKLSGYDTFVPGVPVHLLHMRAPYPLKRFIDTRASDLLHAPQRQWQIKLEVTEWDSRGSKPRPVKQQIHRKSRQRWTWGLFQGQVTVAKQQECLWGQAAGLANGDHESGCSMGSARDYCRADLHAARSYLGARRACSEKHLLFRPANLLRCCNTPPLWHY